MIKTKTTILIIVACIIKLAFHIFADFNSGFQGDELLHIETGKHPSFGYMEFPPVIGWLAYLQNLFHSESVFAHHIFSHIASILIVVLVALTTIALGGKTKSVFIVLLCILVAPTFGRGHQLFQPIVFSQLFWVLSFYQLVRLVKTLESKYLTYLVLSLAFGFLTKFDILFFIAGLSSLLLFKRTQEKVFTKSFLWYLLLFFLIISPNLWWQYQHQFPVLNMFSRLYETQLDELTILGVLQDMIISLNPFTLPIWIGGLLFMFNKKDRNFYLPIALSIAVSILLLAFAKSKAYYFYPAILTLLIFGSIWLEQKVLERKKWTIYPISILLSLSGIVLLPFSLSVLPLETFIKYADIKKEQGFYKIDYSEYYSQKTWPNTLSAIKSIYDSLPASEKKDCMIWGKHYSQAGAVNLLGGKYDLPKAFSYHGSFYLWTASKGKMPGTILAFTNGEANIDFFQDFFYSVVPVKKVCSLHAKESKHACQTIFICKEPKQNFEEMREKFSTRVFE